MFKKVRIYFASYVQLFSKIHWKCKEEKEGSGFFFYNTKTDQHYFLIVLPIPKSEKLF